MCTLKYLSIHKKLAVWVTGHTICSQVRNPKYLQYTSQKSKVPPVSKQRANDEKIHHYMLFNSFCSCM